MRDLGPPTEGRTEVHDGEDLAGVAVVEHVLEAAEAVGRAQRPRGEPVGAVGRFEGGVGGVVVGGPGGGGEEVLQEGQFFGLVVDAGALVAVEGAVLFDDGPGLHAAELVVEGRGQEGAEEEEEEGASQTAAFGLGVGLGGGVVLGREVASGLAGG